MNMGTLLFRRFCGHVSKLKNVCSRGLAASNSLKVDIESTDQGYSIIKMNKKPVNSMNIEFLREMNQAIKMLESDLHCRGAIITSTAPVFCSGLELFDIYNPERRQFEILWREFQALYYKLFTSPLVLISAINGPCLAGGCIIPFSCDYRVMADGKHTIGLPATKIGITPPFWLIETLKYVVGHREAEKMIALSILLKPKEALDRKLVDEVTAPEELLSRSKEAMKEWLSIPDVGRIETKSLIRKRLIEDFQLKQEEDLKLATEWMMKPKLQQMLGSYIEKLKQEPSVSST